MSAQSADLADWGVSIGPLAKSYPSQGQWAEEDRPVFLRTYGAECAEIVVETVTFSDVMWAAKHPAQSGATPAYYVLQRMRDDDMLLPPCDDIVLLNRLVRKETGEALFFETREPISADRFAELVSPFDPALAQRMAPSAGAAAATGADGSSGAPVTGDALGLSLRERNGPVEGFGVVWGLEVEEVRDDSAAAAAGLATGDILISVARFAPSRVESTNQEQMRDLLSAARGGDTYLVTRVRPSDPRPILAREVRLRALFDTGDLDLAGITGSNGTFFAEIYTEDWDRALGRFGGDPDVRAGRRRWLNATQVFYHDVFDGMCDVSAFGPFRVYQKQFVTGTRQGLWGPTSWDAPGPVHEIRVREEFWVSWSEANSRMSSVDFVTRMPVYEDLVLAISQPIRANGCGSESLRAFERRLTEATRRAWQG